MSVAVIGAVDVILRDGGTLRLRPPGAGDTSALVEFFEGLSERSLFLRFHGFRHVDADMVEPLLDPDWNARGALVGCLELGGAERIVAVASYVRLDAGDVAEMAFAVADSEQERGIGTRLLEQLGIRAYEHGISRFVADVLASNTIALRVFGLSLIHISEPTRPY